MKDRVRSKREARTEWASRNQASPLRWMRPKEDNHEPNQRVSYARSPRIDESEKSPEPRMSHYAAVIDFEQDKVTISPFLGTPRSESPQSRACGMRKQLHRQANSSRSVSSDSKHRRTPERTSPTDMTAWDEFSRNSLDSSGQCISLLDSERAVRLKRQTSTEGRSEFGLASLESPETGQTTPPQHLTGSGGATEPHQSILHMLSNAAIVSSIFLAPVDHSLLGYFAVHAGIMLGLDGHVDIVRRHDPILKLFLPFAVANQWCFETMVLMFAANHYRRNDPTSAMTLLDSELHYLASRHNFVLAKTRERISALASSSDSTDEDVVAFLFLALAEYCCGNREMGLMHFKAWKKYCELRRTLGIAPCGLPGKTIVWWCIAMMCEDDVCLDGIINSVTRTKIRENPAKLFRYFENFSVTEGIELSQGRPELADRRITC
jgi:hypothetical protein